MSSNLKIMHQILGIPSDYGVEPQRPCFVEPDELVSIGEDVFAREQRLSPVAASAWQAMQQAAAEAGVELQLVSAFRGYEYQKQLFDRKLARGQCIEEILQVNAAPGFSEHHSGRAVDVTTPGVEPLTEAFADTDCFAWLTREAAKFGFVMSYPPGNPYGFIYEPWHWCYRPA